MASSRKKGPTKRKKPAPQSTRYTPPRLVKRIRPRWHLALGVLELLAGALLVIVNYGEEFGLHVLPGGHQEAYFFAGLAVAGGSMWWFGWFDRPTPLREDS